MSDRILRVALISIGLVTANHALARGDVFSDKVDLETTGGSITNQSLWSMINSGGATDSREKCVSGPGVDLNGSMDVCADLASTPPTLAPVIVADGWQDGYNVIRNLLKFIS